MRTSSVLPAVVLVTILLGACVQLRSSSPHERPVVLQITNKHWEDAAIYLVRGGVPFRLGIVEGNGLRTFRVRAALLGTGSGLTVVAELRTSRVTHASTPFEAEPGQRIQWVLDAHLRPSGVSVW